jgi:hypothetical protein
VPAGVISLDFPAALLIAAIISLLIYGEDPKP